MPINENKLQELQSHHNDPNRLSPNSVPATQVSGTFEEMLVENNKMLKKLIRHQRMETFFSFIKFVIFIGIPAYYAYIYSDLINQYWEISKNMLNSLKGLQSQVDSLQNMTSGLDPEMLKKASTFLKK